jgi:glycosyltransferase involved in cell wall biosynthesis
MSAVPAGRDITVVAHDIGSVGGMERQLTELIAGLLGRGYRVTVIARRCDVQPKPGFRWIRVPGPARPFPLAYPWFLLMGTYKVWRHRAGLVHTTGAITWNKVDVCTVHLCHHGARGSSSAAAASRGLAYGLNRRLSAALARAGERLNYRPSRIRAVAGVSEGVAAEVREYFPGIAAKVSVIPNGVNAVVFRPDARARHDIRAEFGLGASDLVALFVGGDWDWKGLAIAIRGVAAVPGCRLLVVGSGDIERYRRIAQEADAADRVHFAGRQTKTHRYYAAADVFVFPSSYEAFPLVVCEAAASGLPLLATPVSGVRDLLQHGQNGWFIERDQSQIAAKLSILRSDESLRRAMGVRSREVAGRYTWSRVVDDYLSLYARIGARGEASKGDRVALTAGTRS